MLFGVLAAFFICATWRVPHAATISILAHKPYSGPPLSPRASLQLDLPAACRKREALAGLPAGRRPGPAVRLAPAVLRGHRPLQDLRVLSSRPDDQPEQGRRHHRRHRREVGLAHRAGIVLAKRGTGPERDGRAAAAHGSCRPRRGRAEGACRDHQGGGGQPGPRRRGRRRSHLHHVRSRLVFQKLGPLHAAEALRKGAPAIRRDARPEHGGGRRGLRRPPGAAPADHAARPETADGP